MTHQQQLADAEAAYRQALDIDLEFGDRHSAADTKDLQLLNQERALLEPSEFTKLASENVPADLADEFAAAIEA